MANKHKKRKKKASKTSLEQDILLAVAILELIRVVLEIILKLL